MSDITSTISNFLSKSDNPIGGYSRFKTPYFEVSIGLPDGSAPVKLPEQLYRLIQKVEITENYISESCAIDNFSIAFVEGSREPFTSNDAVDTSSLYSVPNGGLLTNRPGLLTDLKFVSKNGFPGITDLTSSEISNLSQQGASFLSDGTPSVITVNNKPTYLFQEGNIVTIEWGYKEDPDSVRIISNVILMVQSEFPETGQPTTTIICNSPVALLDQVTTPFGRSFKRTTFGNINEIGLLKVNYEDISTIDLLSDFCDDHGINLLVSSNILNEKLDKNASKVWVAGESFVQFINKLAKASNCMFRVYIDPKQNYKYTLEFINRVDFQKQTSIPEEDKFLLTYKGNYSIIKSVAIRADFSGLPGTAFGGVDNSGKYHIANSADGGSQVVQFGSPGLIVNHDPGSKSAVLNSVINSGVSSGTNIRTVVNKVAVTPRVDDVRILNDSTLSAFGRCGNRQITLEVTTLGYTELLAGQIIQIFNLGERYSKKYQIRTVTHTLDSSGYNCHFTAFGWMLGGSTGISPTAPSQEKSSNTQSTVEQFKSLIDGTNPSSSDVVKDSRNSRFKNR